MKEILLLDILVNLNNISLWEKAPENIISN